MAAVKHNAERILATAFGAYDGIHEPRETLAGLVISVSDELELVAESLESEVPPIEVSARVVKRAIDRLRLTLEIEAEQVQEASQMATATGFVVPPDSVLYLAPLDECGNPDFDQARAATPNDMKALGWVWYRAVSEAIGILTQPMNEAERSMETRTSEPASGAIAIGVAS